MKFRNHARLKFGIRNIKFIINRNTTDCIEGSFLSIPLKLLGEMRCSSEFAYIRILEIDFCRNIYRLQITVL